MAAFRMRSRRETAMDAWFLVLIGVLALSTWGAIALFARLLKQP